VSRTTSQTRSPAEGGVGILGLMTGLGILSFVLFPFLLPAIAFALVPALPLLAVVLAGALVTAIAVIPLLAIRSIWRRLRRPRPQIPRARGTLVQD
jgi:membrane protein implicated in regulation of membrane protease activity